MNYLAYFYGKNERYYERERDIYEYFIKANLFVAIFSRYFSLTEAKGTLLLTPKHKKERKQTNKDLNKDHLHNKQEANC